MTEQQANEIFKTKYPNGEIKRKNTTAAGRWRYWVIFDKTKNFVKPYFYELESYAQLLKYFGFSVIYSHNVQALEREAAQIESDLTAGGEEDLFFGNGFIPFTAEEIEAKQARLKEIKTTLETSIKA